MTSIVRAGELTLGDDVLDRIDEIVPPGVTLNPADDDHLVPASIGGKRLRRRQRKPEPTLFDAISETRR